MSVAIALDSLFKGRTPLPSGVGGCSKDEAVSDFLSLESVLVCFLHYCDTVDWVIGRASAVYMIDVWMIMVALQD